MAIPLTITGTFLGAGAIKQIGQNNRNTRPFWIDITDNPQFANTPEFQLYGDKVYLTDNLVQGQKIEVKFSLNGRKYQRKDNGKDAVITNLEAYQINVFSTQSAAAVQQPAPRATSQPVQRPVPAQQPVAQPFGSMDDESNDLPF